MRRKRAAAAAVVVALVGSSASAFAPSLARFGAPTSSLLPSSSSSRSSARSRRRSQQQRSGSAPAGRGTSAGRPLFSLIDVPDDFFAVTLFSAGILLSVSRNFNRMRAEERAWERRLEEARRQRWKDDPTASEIDLRRKESAMEWSAYGKPRKEEEERREREQQQQHASSTSRKRGVKVMERDEYDDDDDDDDDYEEPAARRRNKTYMDDDEIERFEAEYGVEYDPYYDDPYAEEELPTNMKYHVDRSYGDRIYENGEIFFKDKKSGLFYRQGAKPRSLSFW